MDAEAGRLAVSQLGGAAAPFLPPIILHANHFQHVFAAENNLLLHFL